MTKPRPPLKSPPPGVRQRRRSDGSWRVWWEPSAEARRLGFQAQDVAADRRGVETAEQLNRMVAAALAGGAGPAMAAVGAQVRADRTVAALIRAYTADPHYRRGLKPATREDYRKAFAAIERDFGDQPVAALTKPAVRAWRAELLEGRRPWQRPLKPGETRPHLARALCAKLALLLSFGELEGWIPEGSNPALRLDGRRQQAWATPPRARVASWAELDALLRAARATGDRSMGVAIALAALTAQRQADIVAARLDAFAVGPDGATWTLTRSKRATFGRIALHPVAAEALRRWLALRPAAAREPGDAALLIAERTGRAYSADLFRKVWAAVRREAAKAAPSVADLQFRDLRRTFGDLARKGAASREDVGVVLGNTAATDPRLEITYMPPSEAVAARAVAAIAAPAGFGEGLFDDED